MVPGGVAIVPTGDSRPRPAWVWPLSLLLHVALLFLLPSLPISRGGADRQDEITVQLEGLRSTGRKVPGTTVVDRAVADRAQVDQAAINRPVIVGGSATSRPGEPSPTMRPTEPTGPNRSEPAPAERASGDLGLTRDQRVQSMLPTDDQRHVGGLPSDQSPIAGLGVVLARALDSVPIPPLDGLPMINDWPPGMRVRARVLLQPDGRAESVEILFGSGIVALDELIRRELLKGPYSMPRQQGRPVATQIDYVIEGPQLPTVMMPGSGGNHPPGGWGPPGSPLLGPPPTRVYARPDLSELPVRR